MFERAICPECGGHRTERVNVDWEVDRVVETRICNYCPTQYDCNYGDPYKETTHVEENNAD